MFNWFGLKQTFKYVVDFTIAESKLVKQEVSSCSSKFYNQCEEYIWFAWDSNPWPQDGGRTWIHRATTASPSTQKRKQLLFTFSYKFDSRTRKTGIDRICSTQISAWQMKKTCLCRGNRSNLVTASRAWSYIDISA